MQKRSCKLFGAIAVFATIIVTQQVYVNVLKSNTQYFIDPSFVVDGLRQSGLFNSLERSDNKETNGTNYLRQIFNKFIAINLTSASICNRNYVRSIYGNTRKKISLVGVSEDNSLYFSKLDTNSSCFNKGTNFVKSVVAKPRVCICKDSFHGSDCAIPAAVWNSPDMQVFKPYIRRRKVPRRIINGFPFNHEFDLLEARINELKDSVDLFVVLESLYTSFGSKKPLRLYDRLQQGYLEHFKDKILYVYLDELPGSPQTNGPQIEHLLRCYLSKQGLARIHGMRDDDMFILSDADEVPSAEVVNFLKLHEGYPDIAKLILKWNVFGFFWKVTDINMNERTTSVFSVSSLKVLLDQLSGDAFSVRSNKFQGPSCIIGTDVYYAGWHCSWCLRSHESRAQAFRNMTDRDYTPEDIVLKMDSAQSGDPPRLGDDPTKKNLTYIRECIRKGRYFFPSPPFKSSDMDDYMFAPEYLIENYGKYRHLLTLS